MNTSLHSMIGRIAMVAVVAAMAVPAAAQAVAAPPQSAIDNASATWAAKAKLLDAHGQPMFDQLPPLSAVENASATWAAKARLLDPEGKPIPNAMVTTVSATDGFDWGDFGIGLGAMLGLVLLLAGLGTALHVSRSHRPRTLGA